MKERLVERKQVLANKDASPFPCCFVAVVLVAVVVIVVVLFGLDGGPEP